MKLTDKRIVKALLSSKGIRYPEMPEDLFIMAHPGDGKLIVIKGTDFLCEFKPYVWALAQDNWYIMK